MLSLRTLKNWIAGSLLLALGCAGQVGAKDEISQDLLVPRPTPKAVVLDSESPSLDGRDMSGLLADAGKQVAQADTTETDKDEKDEKGKKKELKRDYSTLIKEPSKLGFEPDDALFRNVYYYIKKSFVEDVPSTELFAGVQSEVRDLLDQAEIPSEGIENLDPDRKVLPQILDLYGEKVDPHLLTFSAILGMLDGLDDRYSLLMLPEDYAKLQEQMQAKEFGGIGIYIELDRDDENRLTVFEPIEGTPAYKAGLMAGDKVMEIDGESTDGITLDQAQSKIRGPYETKVVLGISRKGEAGQLTIPVVRGKIHVVSTSSKMLEGDIGYVRLRLFGSKTAEEMGEAISKLQKKGAHSLIIDLRNNGGGYIDAAVDVVGQFLNKNAGLVVYTIDRNNRRSEYRANERGTLKIPTVVLINEFSASASEITAGALRDHGLAKLIGVKSFGKGSVQQLYPFADGSALKLTVSKFYTPSGYVINKQGLDPDIEIKMEPRYVGRGEKDVQLKKAVEFFKKGTAAKVGTGA